MKNNETMMWIVIAVIIVLLFSGFGMMGFPFGGMMYGFGFGWLFMILIAVTLVLFIVWLIKQLQGK